MDYLDFLALGGGGDRPRPVGTRFLRQRVSHNETLRLFDFISPAGFLLRLAANLRGNSERGPLAAGSLGFLRCRGTRRKSRASPSLTCPRGLRVLDRQQVTMVRLREAQLEPLYNIDL